MAPRLIADTIPELVPMYRKPGVHVSHIINHICEKLGKYDSDRGRPAQIMLEFGCAMEDLLAKIVAKRFADTFPDRYIHGMELGRDGITGNLDLFDCQDYAVEECKLTKLSLRHDIESAKFWSFWNQLKTYVCMVPGCFLGRLHITHVNGNYSNDPVLGTWCYRCYEDTWSQPELDKHWRMVVTNAVINEGVS